MDGGNWRPSPGAADPSAVAAAAGIEHNNAADWRSHLQPEARQRIVAKIMETLKKHLPVSVPEGLSELQKIAVRFEEKIYAAASSQPDYLRKISLKMLSMETKTQQTSPINPSMQMASIANPSSIDGGLQSQGGNPGQSLPIPLINQPASRQSIVSQSVQNSSSTVQTSSITGLNQPLQGISQAQTLPNMSGMSQNNMNTSLGQVGQADVYSNTQRQMQGRQQPQQIYQQQQQQVMKHRIQQTHLQQHSQQQTMMQSSQQPIMQMPSNAQQPGHSAIQQTQPLSMQSAQQQNQFNAIQQSVQSLLQPTPQSLARQQQQTQTSILQQPSLPVATVTQQAAQQQQQQQLVGQQQNMQQSQLLGQPSSSIELQQHQQRLPTQQSNLLSNQQAQQMINQQNMSLIRQQQLGSQTNMSTMQQQHLLSTVSGVPNMQVQRQLQILQQSKGVVQPQQPATQGSMGLLQQQSQQSQVPQSQHHISQYQSQPAQQQQQVAPHHPSVTREMHQRIQASTGLLQQQNMIDQQKQLLQAQRVTQEVSSSPSLDSTAQTGHVNIAELQEEIYQKIKILKERYYADLNDFYQKISMKLHQLDAIMPSAKPVEQYEKMKGFKMMLERLLSFLQVNKSSIQPNFKEKVPLVEKQILNMLNSHRKRPTQFQQPVGQNAAIPQQLPSQISQMQQHDNHTNQLQPVNLQGMTATLQTGSAPGMLPAQGPSPGNVSVSMTQQNLMNASAATSNLDTNQGTILSSLQQGALGALPQGGAGHLQNSSNLSQQQQMNANILAQNTVNSLQPNVNALHSTVNTIQQQHQQRQMQLMHQQQKQMPPQQLPLQQQFQQQVKQQQPSQIQMPPLHQVNEGSDLKVRPRALLKPEPHQQHPGPRSTFHQHLKPAASLSIPSPQNLQALSPQITHNSSQIDPHVQLPSQQKVLIPSNSPFAPSPATPIAPSPAGDTEKPSGSISAITNIAQIGQQQSIQPAQLAVVTPGISASPLLAEFTSVDAVHGNATSQNLAKSNVQVRPIDRLLKEVQLGNPRSLCSAVGDIRSIVSMVDRIAGSAPGNGSRAAVGEDLAAMTKCRLQARNFMAHDGSTTSKRKRETQAMPLINVPSAGSVNDSFKLPNHFDTPELQSTATSCVKFFRVETNDVLLEEIQEINRQLIDTKVNISEQTDGSLDDLEPEATEGIVVYCTYTAVAVSPSLKSHLASTQMGPIVPLRVLVPCNYPKSSPIILDKISDDHLSGGDCDNLSNKVRSRFSASFRSLSQPISVREIARAWDADVHKVIAEYAESMGGGSFSSVFGTFETTVGV